MSETYLRPWDARNLNSAVIGDDSPVLDFHAEVDGLHNIHESDVEGVSFRVDLIAVVHSYALPHDLQKKPSCHFDTRVKEMHSA